jgi:hypothetical protein
LEIQRQRRKKFRREKEYPPFIKYRMGKWRRTASTFISSVRVESRLQIMSESDFSSNMPLSRCKGGEGRGLMAREVHDRSIILCVRLNMLKSPQQLYHWLGQARSYKFC